MQYTVLYKRFLWTSPYTERILCWKLEKSGMKGLQMRFLKVEFNFSTANLVRCVKRKKFAKYERNCQTRLSSTRLRVWEAKLIESGMKQCDSLIPRCFIQLLVCLASHIKAVVKMVQQKRSLCERPPRWGGGVMIYGLILLIWLTRCCVVRGPTPLVVWPGPNIWCYARAHNIILFIQIPQTTDFNCLQLLVHCKSWP